MATRAGSMTRRSAFCVGLGSNSQFGLHFVSSAEDGRNVGITGHFTGYSLQIGDATAVQMADLLMALRFRQLVDG